MTLLHRPVMAREVVEFLAARQGGVFVDATYGGGGHTRELLGANPVNRVLACDRDRTALTAGRRSLGRDAGRVEFLHDDYRHLPDLLTQRPDLALHPAAPARVRRYEGRGRGPGKSRLPGSLE